MSYKRIKFDSHIRNKRSRLQIKNNGIKDIIILQLIICTAIFAIIFLVRIFNINFTDYLISNIKKSITLNYGFNDLYQDTNKIIQKIFPNLSLNGVGGNVSESEEIDDIENVLDDEEFEDLKSQVKQKRIVYPVSTGQVSSVFGERENPFDKNKNQIHKGLDIAAPKGSEIYAVMEGTVIKSEYSNSYGNYIEIDHGDGITTRYAHCSELLSNVGDRVLSGELIAKVGTTGQSTGNHLHLEMIKNNIHVDPAKIFDGVSND